MHVDIAFAETIAKLSPDFVRIFNQASAAEDAELLEVCGPGYRKALEFLIKDYIITALGKAREDVQRSPLGRCIDEFIDDTRIKAAAARAAWLGNDETHYYRKWEDRDLGDLKNLIQMTVDWIDIGIRTQEIVSEMPSTP